MRVSVAVRASVGVKSNQQVTVGVGEESLKLLSMILRTVPDHLSPIFTPTGSTRVGPYQLLGPSSTTTLLENNLFVLFPGASATGSTHTARRSALRPTLHPRGRGFFNQRVQNSASMSAFNSTMRSLLLSRWPSSARKEKENRRKGKRLLPIS